MNPLKTVIASCFLCAASASHATPTATTDFSDLWFNPAEPGWGANVIQQGRTLFVTIFVYNTANQPTWYVASDVRLTGNSGATSTFSGTLYETAGPWFGNTSFDGASVTVRPVGNLTFSAGQPANATLTYTVGNNTVSKQVERQTWDVENIAGTYLGASAGTWSNCSAGRANGPVESFAQLTITQDGRSVQIREEGTSSNYTCSYNGTYTQQGRMGTISGNGLCSDGINVTFLATEVQPNAQGITMKVASNQITGTCQLTGRMGGMRRGP
jgi:hypothetical protein